MTGSWERGVDRLALLAVVSLATVLVSVVSEVAGEAAPGCRPSCAQAKSTCVTQVNDQRKSSTL